MKLVNHHSLTKDHKIYLLFNIIYNIPIRKGIQHFIVDNIKDFSFSELSNDVECIFNHQLGLLCKVRTTFIRTNLPASRLAAAAALINSRWWWIICKSRMRCATCRKSVVSQISPVIYHPAFLSNGRIAFPQAKYAFGIVFCWTHVSHMSFYWPHTVTHI